MADTEVFHEACLGQIPQSLANRLKLRVLDLQGRVKQLEADAAEVARLRTAIDDAYRDQRTLRVERDRLSNELRDLRGATHTSIRASEYQEDRLNRATQENERLARELEAARREVALHQTIQGNPQTMETRFTPQTAVTPVTTQPPPAAKQSDMWTDMETRFSLLEIEDKK